MTLLLGKKPNKIEATNIGLMTVVLLKPKASINRRSIVTSWWSIGRTIKVKMVKVY